MSNARFGSAGQSMDGVLGGTGRWSTQTLVRCWLVILVGVFAAGLYVVGWPFVDLYEVLWNTTSRSWRETIAWAFGGGTEYRPVMVLLIKAVYMMAGPTLWIYKILVLGQFALLLHLLVRVMAPSGRGATLAAGTALCCVAGFHTSRHLMNFWPMNSHSLVLAAVLGSAVICLSPWRRWHDWALPFLTVGALLIIELGLLIPPMVLALWMARAPGVSKRGLVLTLGAVAFYVGVRLMLSSQGSIPLVYTETGLGFSSEVSQERLTEIFARAPFLFWTYNVSATALSVLFSEPRAGRFVFIESLLKGGTPPWLWWHVGVSALTTIVVIAGLAGWRTAANRDRQTMVVGIVLFMGSALGFLYTRDRIGTAPGAGYSLLLYAGLLHSWREGIWGSRRLAAAVLALILCGWIVRDGEAVLRMRDTAWGSYLEWTERYEDLGGLVKPQTELLSRLKAEVLARPPANPRNDPAWTYSLFEREYTPNSTSP